MAREVLEALEDEEDGDASNLVKEPADSFEDAHQAALRRLLDPIVIDRDGDGIELIARSSSNVYFDMDGDGRKELTGWVGKDDALLAIDENNNGKIDSIVELVGDLNRSGFTELLTYDVNGDKVIDSKDAIFSKLRVWTDANSNGITDAGEMVSITSAGIKAIDLNYITFNFTAEGNRIHEQSTFERTNGTVGTVADAWFDVDNVNTQTDPTTTGQPTVDALPDIPGYGNVASLRTVMATDGALTSLVADVVNRQPDNLTGLRTATESIIYRWTRTTAIATDSRGSTFDGRKLAALEQMLGTGFNAGGMTNPNAQASGSLTTAWNSLVDGLMARLFLGGSFGEILETSTVYAPSFDRTISTATPSEILDQLKTARPIGGSLDIVNYWSAAVVVAQEIAGDSGVNTSIAEYSNLVIDAVADDGLAPFVPYLAGGVAALPSRGIFSSNGIFAGVATNEQITLTGDHQAVYAEDGNDRIVVSTNNYYSAFLLSGGSGNDTLQSGAGSDWLDGGQGIDTMYGGSGDDTYTVDNAGDQVVEASGGGNDTVRSSIGYVLSANLENLILLGTAAVNGTGNALANSLTGNSAANVLLGYAGDDTLDGRAGADTLYGGLGRDTYVVDNAGDRVIEEGRNGTYPGAADWDVVKASVSFVAPALVEEIQLQGSAAINATGNALNNYLTGNTGANTLDGGLGADRMYGGAGSDTYIVDNASDSVSEDAASGTDTVRASVGYSLGANLENLILTGTLNTDGTGNELANVLTGNAGENRLDGQGGADKMTGGAGDDLYIVDNAGDRVVEAAGGGIDTVETTLASYTLAAEAENLRLFVNGYYYEQVNRNGTGNALANTIEGTNGINVLKGLDGNDQLYGYDGNDMLEGGIGNDVLDGGTGNDKMAGGAGNDLFVVDSAADTVTEALNEGADTVQASVSLILGANLENLELTGTANRTARATRWPTGFPATPAATTWTAGPAPTS